MDWTVDEFADIGVLRYKVPGYEELSYDDKNLVYCLYQAARWGRDIYWQQNCANNLPLRDFLESIVKGYPGDRTTAEWQDFMTYVKQVWFSNGVHHHYSGDKHVPKFSREYLDQLVAELGLSGTVEEYIFNQIDSKKVCKDPNADKVVNSAVNFYRGTVTQEQVENFYKQMPETPEPLTYGMNTTIVGGPGKVGEIVWKVASLYGKYLEKIVMWLERAIIFSSDVQQRKVLQLLIDFYRTGDLYIWNRYNIEWLKMNTNIGFISGFIENYNDPLNRKCSFEMVVWIRDPEASRRVELLSDNAQWFEDHAPIDPEHRKPLAKGIKAEVINLVTKSGYASPSVYIGVCLPNEEWLREKYGSKSHTLNNIIDAYDAAARQSKSLEEFCATSEEVARAREHLDYISKITVDLHEVLGHGSGQLEAGVDDKALKEYHDVIEETRADLFALYYVADPKLQELGLVSDFEQVKAAYDVEMRNGLLVQLVRIELGKDIIQAHMRNRALIARWVLAHGQGAVEIIKVNGKTIVQILDYQRMRELYGLLLKEIQRVKSQGDYRGARDLVETYGVKIDQELHAEILERYAKLGLKPYKGFINPVIHPQSIEYPRDFAQQMLDYSREYSL